MLVPMHRVLLFMMSMAISYLLFSAGHPIICHVFGFLAPFAFLKADVEIYKRDN